MMHISLHHSILQNCIKQHPYVHVVTCDPMCFIPRVQNFHANESGVTT